MKFLLAVRKMRLRFALVPSLVLVCLLLFATRAEAACGAPAGEQQDGAKLPSFLDGDDATFFPSTNIVGLWHAIYTIEGTTTVFNDSFKAWHPDGTEVESAYLSPQGGNVCMGVWKWMGGRNARLHHIGWLFDPKSPGTTAVGYFTMNEEVTVLPRGQQYVGTFVFKVWNMDGTPTKTEIKGTIAATRLKI